MVGNPPINPVMEGYAVIQDLANPWMAARALQHAHGGAGHQNAPIGTNSCNGRRPASSRIP